MHGEVVLPESRPSGGSSFGPRERWFFGLILAAILVWGFGGSWELPEKETVGGIERARPEAPQPQSESLAATGARLFRDNGCNACHSTEGETKIGPALNGILGREVSFSDGTATVIDEDYIVESILAPQARRVAGFEAAEMPDYTGLVDEDDARALAAFIRTLR